MKLDKRHMGVSVVMLVGSIVYNVWVFTGAGKSTATPAQPSAQVQALPSGEPAIGGGPIDPAQVEALPDVALDRLPDWPRNPFQNVRQPDAVAVTEDAPAPSPVPVAEPVVATIMYSSDRRAAVIDGHVVRIGDMIGTSKIVDILPKAVIIDSPDRGRRTLEMKRATGTGSAGGAGAAGTKSETAPGGRK